MSTTDQVLYSMRMVPRWGTPVVHVSWQPKRGVEQLPMKLQRSYDGIAWTDVTPTAVVGLVSADDTDVAVSYDLQKPSYRVKATSLTGKVAYSRTFKMYSHVPRKAFLLARCLMAREHMYMRADGTPEVLVVHKIVNGAPCTCKDTTSGVTIGTNVCPYCFGTGNYGGYQVPYRTYCKFLALESIDTKLVHDGSGKAPDNMQKARLFGVDGINVDDLIAVPGTDERYVVVNGGSTDMIMGYLPAATELTLKKLDPRDVRQTIPINVT